MKPTLTEALSAAATPQKGPECSIIVLASELTDDERAALRAAFAGDLSHAGISAAVKAAGKRHVSSDTVSRHRRGLCSCEARGFTL